MAALIKRQLGQWDVVEDRRYEAQDQGGHPRSPVGARSTGMTEADDTSASRRRLLRAEPEPSFQLGGLRRAPAINTSHSAEPETGSCPPATPAPRWSPTFVQTATPTPSTTMPSARPSTRERRRVSRAERAHVSPAASEATVPKTTQRDSRAEVGGQDRQRAHAVDPHHRGRRVAENAAGAAGVGGRDDAAR